ncbi:SprT-like domain-containing protein [Flavobacterium agricola]|uniref:SprT-like domain-containing protein n=1 Tax=Flavobacterium agricola TaxID=2870839 RepID=A0ABY6M3B5_9FLAO|nr:SprT-like domain-containing protein [Flavobacterium agricola]UYW01478.1 SprT-like domain-containing protein [Flavobacterium agricola]
MENVLLKYIPENALQPIVALIKMNHVHLKIVAERATRHGDYRANFDGTHIITVNASLNKYSFLMTLIHEIAHLVAYKKYGNRIKPHGVEWKDTFQKLMLPFLRPEIFPSQLLPLLARHFKNPSASSDTDATLSLALKQFDPPSGKSFIFEIPYGSIFTLDNGRTFKKIALRTKRYECIELSNGRTFLFNPNAEVNLVEA